MLRKLALSTALFCAACNSGVKNDVSSRLIDPASAQFFELATLNGATCGLVNSKNRMGGYTGATIFVAKGGDVAFWGDHNFQQLGGTLACSPEALTIFLGNEARRLREQNDRF